VLGLLSSRALAAFDALAAGGVDAPVISGRPVIAGYQDRAGRAPLVAELKRVSQHAGPAADYDLLDGAEVQQAEPAFGLDIRAAVRIHGQRYLEPGAFLGALAASVRRRGGQIQDGTQVTRLRAGRDGVTVTTGQGGGRAAASSVPDAGQESRYDSVVVATGAWLGELARPAGARIRVQSGRGYSFSVPVARLPGGPVYLPAQRLACTPLPGGRLRAADRHRCRGARGGVGRGPALHAGRPAGHRRHPVAGYLRGGRPRHVGDHARPGHRAASRPGHRDRADTWRAGPVQPAPLSLVG
jgi:D-amino-acid dehydrogenase